MTGGNVYWNDTQKRYESKVTLASGKRITLRGTEQKALETYRDAITAQERAIRYGALHKDLQPYLQAARASGERLPSELEDLSLLLLEALLTWLRRQETA